ncbi:antitoxin VbhA family protein [Paracandidimonas soli]|uniref:antitoxin VbhA family protein n=1 Tax=Paracandidimonas soli TaxID=1917182 RepID=UPI00140554C5
MSTISRKNQQRISNVVGSWRLEGLTVETQVLADSQRIVRGEMTIDAAVQNALARIKLRSGKSSYDEVQ